MLQLSSKWKNCPKLNLQGIFLYSLQVFEWLCFCSCMSESLFFLWQVCLNTIIHTLKWKKLIWPTKGGQTSGCSLVLAWGQFGPIEIEIFLPSIFGAKSTYRSYSVIRRTVFFKKFLISTKNYCQSLGASYLFPKQFFLITVTGTISSK